MSDNSKIIKIEPGQTVYITCPGCPPCKIWYSEQKRDILVQEIDPRDVPRMPARPKQPEPAPTAFANHDEQIRAAIGPSFPVYDTRTEAETPRDETTGPYSDDQAQPAPVPLPEVQSELVEQMTQPDDCSDIPFFDLTS
jgi:hypothetical protein